MGKERTNLLCAEDGGCRMSQSAFITFVEESAVQGVTLEELKNQLLHYREQLERTGQQLGWNYAAAAFPYTIVEPEEGKGRWFYLKGNNELYRYILFGVGNREVDGAVRRHVQVTLHDDCTHGDKAKANEFCKYLAKTWKAELRLFNGRVFHYNHK